MQVYRRGDRGPAVARIRAALRGAHLLPAGAEWPAGRPQASSGTAGAPYDDCVEEAVRAFQQRRGLLVDGVVGPETWRALEEARHRLGDRLLSFQVSHPLVGDDIVALQERLLSLGFDVGRCDGVFSGRSDAALRDFQRNWGLAVDGLCGPATLRALGQLSGSPAVGGRVHELREAEALRLRGPSLADKIVVVDPGHGDGDEGWVVNGLSERTVVADIASRLEARLTLAGVTVLLTHGPDGNPNEVERADVANSTGADLLVSLHGEGNKSPHCEGVASYYFGSAHASASVLGERFADLIQREVVARTGLRDARTHPKTWDLIRRTRMPAVRLEVGYLTHHEDHARLADPTVRDNIAEGVLVAVQRLFLPPDLDPPTGQLRLPALVSAAH